MTTTPAFTATTNPEAPTRVLIFTFAEPIVDVETRQAAWEAIDEWIERQFAGSNRMSGGLAMSDTRFSVSLRFDQYDRMPAVAR